MDPTEGSETSAIINQTPGNYPKESLLQVRYCLFHDVGYVHLNFVPWDTCRTFFTFARFRRNSPDIFFSDVSWV